MREYDLIVIGFGKAGKTLVARQAAAGKKVVLIEKSPAMYGGTCINIACIPTKTMLVAAEKGLGFDEVMAQRSAVVSRLNKKNYAAVSGTADVIDARARFVSNKVVEVSAGADTELLTAAAIVINTGAVPVIPDIPGLAGSAYAYDSTGIQGLSSRPGRLGIIGGGHIGLEFAGIFNKLGTEVTVFVNGPGILRGTEPEIADLAYSYMKEDGIRFELDSAVASVEDSRGAAVLSTNKGDFTFDAVLYAVGRRPNIDGLGLEATDIELTDSGAIKTDRFLQTAVPGVFAAGDVNGGLQFTYISLDDFRIINAYLSRAGQDGQTYSLADRKNIPTATFITPPLAQIGLTEAQAQGQGLDYRAKTLPVASMPRAHVNNDLRGMFKAIISRGDGRILGATLFGSQAHELINLIKMAMDNNIPAEYLASQVFTHPTMAENCNDLFAA